MVFHMHRVDIHQFLNLLILLYGYDWLVCALPNFITSDRVHYVQQTLIAVNIVVLDILRRNLIK